MSFSELLCGNCQKIIKTKQKSTECNSALFIIHFIINVLIYHLIVIVHCTQNLKKSNFAVPVAPTTVVVMQLTYPAWVLMLLI